MDGDPHNSYITVGVDADSNLVARICIINPSGNNPYKAEIYAQSPGIRSPRKFGGRVVTFLQFLAHLLLSPPAGGFFDDVCCAKPRRCVASGFLAYKQLGPLLRYPTSGRIGHRPTTTIVLFGAEASMGDSFIRDQARPCSVGEIGAYFEGTIRATHRACRRK